MANVARVEATITAQNRLRPGLTSASRDLDKFRNAQTKAARAFAASAAQFRGLERMERVAGTLSRGAAALGGAFALNRAGHALKEATTRFADLDRAMTRTGITGDAAAEEVTKGTEELRNLARQTATLFEPAQKGLDAITASGREFGEAMKMMPSVLRTAQASGAGVEEIANSSTALLDHMKISIEGLQEAQDTLAKGGKLGKFELKDMARYLPSMLPAFKALGAEGQSGLRSLVAMLQVIRSGTGTAEEAAASASNIFQKMESEETTKRFQKFGIDLRKEMAKARKEGRNLSEVFVELSNKALKGDLSKLPQLFSDMEFARGMRALIAGRDKYREYLGDLGKSSGTIATDLKRVTEDAQANIDRLREGADRAKTAFGGLTAELGSPLIKQGADNFDALAQSMERATKAAREGGAGAAVKQVVGEFTESVAKDWAEGRQQSRDMQQRYDDEQQIKRIEDPKRGGWFDWLIGDTSRGATQAALDKLNEKEKRGPLNAFERTNKKTFEKRLADEDNAWSRDQMRRVGPLPEQVTSSSPEFANAIEGAREARRGAAFSRSASDSAPSVPKGLAQKGGVLPPHRPAELGGGSFPAFVLDDAKSKVAEVSTSIEALGPVGASAGTALASGITSGISQMEAELSAAITRMQQKLNSLHAPSLSFGGLGGFNTGKGMGEVR